MLRSSLPEPAPPQVLAPQPGDVVVRRHTFSNEDYESFANLSGDWNPIHDARALANLDPPEDPIVPLALSLSVFSGLVGTQIPGVGALILALDVKPRAKLLFGEEAAFSVRVESFSAAAQTFVLRLLAVRDTTIVVEGRMHVQLTPTRGRARRHAPGHATLAARRPLAAVTGAGGGLGGAIARALARAGYDLLLVGRACGATTELRGACEADGAYVRELAADLASATELSRLCDELRSASVDTLVHAAAQPLHASAADHLALGYTAFGALVDATLHSMLSRQHGQIVFVSTRARRYRQRDLADYVAAKDAGVGFAIGVDAANGQFGVQMLIAEPDYISGAYSREIRPHGATALLPEEVAEAIVTELRTVDASGGRILSVTTEGTECSPLRTVTLSNVPGHDRPATPSTREPAGRAGDLRSQIAAVVLDCLDLPPGTDLTHSGVGLIEGWDSLANIMIIVHLEDQFGIRLPSNALAAAGRFDGLCELVETGVSALAQ